MRFKRIYIEIGNICNLSCLFCSKKDRTNKVMSVSEFKHVIKEVSPFTDHIYLHVLGEPLIHKDFKSILDICDINNIKCNITTNGTLIKDRFNIITESNSIRQINVSLHALAELTEFDRIIYLDNLIKLIRWNEESKKIYLSLRLWINNKELNDFIFDYFSKEFNKIVNKDTLRLTDKTFFSFDNEFEWPSLDNEYISSRGRCLGTITHIGILANGDVTMCCLDANGVEVLGNIFKESLSDIINGSKFKAIHDGFLRNELVSELCRRCTYRKRFKY